MGIETALGGALGKSLLGGGLGAIGGALSDDPSQLSSFVDAFGDPNLPGSTAQITVDPANLLAQGVGRNELLFNAISGLAAQPTQLGPASIIQTAPFSFGGALPAPIGIGIRDPGFLQRPGIDIFGAQPEADDGFPPDVPDGGGRPPRDNPDEPGQPPPRTGPMPLPVGVPPSDARRPIDPGDGTGSPIRPIPLDFPTPDDGRRPIGDDGTSPIALGFTPNLPTTIPTQRGELSQFLDAINLANMSRARPFVQGGLT